MSEADDNFYNRADEHIHLANEQVNEQVTKTKVSASFLYGSSRFQAWISACTCDSAEEMEQEKEEFIKYFLEVYKKNLTENLEDYIENFNEYMGISSSE